MRFVNTAAFIVTDTIVSLRVIFVPLRNTALHGTRALAAFGFLSVLVADLLRGRLIQLDDAELAFDM